MPDPGHRPNQLAREKSPYLLQHAFNPVDWVPWGEEAFARARAEDRPIFLSIGYATCHWCHVMEHESFEDEDVAALLNRDFVSIKVDREERPDGTVAQAVGVVLDDREDGTAVRQTRGLADVVGPRRAVEFDPGIEARGGVGAVDCCAGAGGAGANAARRRRGCASGRCGETQGGARQVYETTAGEEGRAIHGPSGVDGR